MKWHKGNKIKKDASIWTAPQKLDTKSNEVRCSFYMAKYSEEFKLEVVQYYLTGFGKRSTSQKFKVAPSDVHKWVMAYQEYGLNGLIRKTRKPSFSADFKLTVVQTVIEEGLSLNDAALRFGLGNKGISISNWLRLYHSHGIEGLQPKPIGRRRKMSAQPPVPVKAHDDKSQAELLEELSYLRAENAFLKKLQALRLEQQAKQRKLRDLSQD